MLKLANLDPLSRHQRQALTFFMRREEGLHPSENTIGIWSRQTNVKGENMYNAHLRRTVDMLTLVVPALSTPLRIAHSQYCPPFGEAGFLQTRWALARR